MLCICAGVIFLLTCIKKQSFRKKWVGPEKDRFFLLFFFFNFFFQSFGIKVGFLLSSHPPLYFSASSSCSFLPLPLPIPLALPPLLPLSLPPLEVRAGSNPVTTPLPLPRPLAPAPPLALMIRLRVSLLESRTWTVRVMAKGLFPSPGSPLRHKGHPELYRLRMYPQIHAQHPGAFRHFRHRMAWCLSSSWHNKHRHRSGIPGIHSPHAGGMHSLWEDPWHSGGGVKDHASSSSYGSMYSYSSSSSSEEPS